MLAVVEEVLAGRGVGPLHRSARLVSPEEQVEVVHMVSYYLPESEPVFSGGLLLLSMVFFCFLFLWPKDRPREVTTKLSC